MTDLNLTPHPPVDLHGAFPAGYRAMNRLEQAQAEGPLPHTLYELVKLRASQINGCAFCLELHQHEALRAGEDLDRLAVLRAWRESDRFTHDERVALAVTEAVTRIADGPMAPALEAEARRTFGEEGYAALIYAVATINAWNRLAITGHAVPGSYRPEPPST